MSPFIGFIGVGIMGEGMLTNLCNKIDSEFVIWNRSVGVSERMKSMFPKKISVASSAAEVVKQCSVTYTMLSTLEASAAVYDAPDVGVLAGVSAGKLIVDCATLSPERMIEEAAAVTAKGGRFVEAPVSGSKGPAESGTLIFLCGSNDETDYNAIAPALNAMGKAKFYFGEVGQGTKVKLVVNMIMGTMMGAFTEGMVLAKAADVPLDTLLQVLDLGAMSNPMFRGKGPSIINDKHPTNFPLKHAQKDMKLALDLAKHQDVVLPTTTAANEVMIRAMNEKSAGDEDFSAMVKGVAL